MLTRCRIVDRNDLKMLKRKILYGIFLFFLNIFSVKSMDDNNIEKYKELYSSMRKLQNPTLYSQIPELSKERIESLYSYIINEASIFDEEDLSNITKQYGETPDVKEIFQWHESNYDGNLYKALEENLINDMHLCLRKKTNDILPIGIIQNHPIKTEEALEGCYSVGTALLLNNRFLLTARHVLENNWFKINNQEGVFSSGEFPPKYLEQNKDKITYFDKILKFFNCEGKEATIKKFAFLVDNIECKGTNEKYEIVKIEKNSIDIGIAYLDTEIDHNFSINFATELPNDNENLYVAFIAGQNGKECFLVEQSNVFTYFNLKEKGINILEDYQKMLFFDNALIPGISGAPVLLSIKDYNISAVGIFNKKIEVVDKDKVRLLFAFSPISRYVEDIKQKMKEVEN
jgi:hypothetical protein